jgi:hypothetical protein
MHPKLGKLFEISILFCQEGVHRGQWCKPEADLTFQNYFSEFIPQVLGEG